MADLNQIKQDIAQQEQSFQQAKTQIQQTYKPEQRTRSQLQRANLQQQISYRTQEQARQKAKQQALSQLSSQEKEFQKQVTEVEQQISEYETAKVASEKRANYLRDVAKSVAEGSDIPSGLNKSEERAIREIQDLVKSRGAGISQKISAGILSPELDPITYGDVRYEGGKYSVQPWEKSYTESYNKLEPLSVDLDLSKSQVTSKLPEAFQPQTSKFEKAIGMSFSLPPKQYQVGRDTQGNPVYSYKKPEVEYAPPKWFDDTSSMTNINKKPIYSKISSYVASSISPSGIKVDVIGPKDIINYMANTRSPQERVSDYLRKRNVDLTRVGEKSRYKIISAVTSPIRDIAKFETTIKEGKDVEKKQQKRLDKILKDINTAETSEEQEQALKDLRKMGGDYNLVGDNIEITIPEIKKSKGALYTIGSSIATDFIGGTRAFSEAVTGKIEKGVQKMPLKIIRTISETPKAIKTIAYEKSSLKPTIEFFKKTPSPTEWKLTQNILIGGFTKEGKYKAISSSSIGAPFVPIEKTYQKEIKERRIEPGRTRFFLSKLGEGYEQAFTGFGETYFKAQEGRYISPWVGVKSPEYEFSPQAKIVGKVGKVVGESSLYAAPVVGEVAAVLPFAEARGRKEFKKYVVENPWETALTAAFLGGQALRGLRYAKQTKLIPAEAQPRPIAEAVQVINPTKTPFLSKAELAVRYTSPGRRYAKVPRYTEWFYKKPIVTEAGEVIMEPKLFPKLYKSIKPEVLTTPSKTYVVRGTGTSFGKYNIIEAFEQRVGAKQKLMLKITGKSGKITEREWNLLPKNIKDLLRKAVSDETGGPLLSDIRLKEYLRAGKEVSYSPSIKIERQFKYKEPVVVDIKSPELAFDIKTTGRKPVAVEIKYEQPSMTISGIKPAKGKDVFTRMASITETEPKYFVGTSEGQGIGIYKGKTVIGKNKPSFVDELIIKTGQQGSEPFSIKPKEIKEFKKYFGQKSSKEYIQSLYTKTEGVKSDLVENQFQGMKDVFVAGAETSLPKQTYVPKIKTSERSVLGLSYIPEEGAIEKPISQKVLDRPLASSLVISENREQIKTEQIPRVIQKPIIEEALFPLSRTELKPMTKLIIKPAIKEVIKPIEKSVIKPLTKTIIKPILKPLVKTTIKPVIKTIPKIIPKSVTKTPVSRIPRIPIIPVPVTETTPFIRTQEEPSTREQLFVPEIRRGGKWYGLGNVKTLKRAEEIAKRKALGTAGVSIRVKKGKEFVSLEPSKYFRKSKREEGVLIQKKLKRIISPGEKMEISYVGARAARTKRKRKKKRKEGIKFFR